MKNSTNQNKQGMIDWMLSIDFDPVEIVHVKHDTTAAYVSLLDEKALNPKRGD